MCIFVSTYRPYVFFVEMDENTLHMSREPRSAAEGKTIFCYNDMTSSFKCSITITYSIVHLMHVRIKLTMK